MSLRVRLPDGRTDRWESVSDERTWFDHTHEVTADELIIYQHTFRRVRERADRTHDVLMWKHHTTKVARRYRAGEWSGITHVRVRTPPYAVERVSRPAMVPRVRERRRR